MYGSWGGRINSQILGVKGLTFHDQSKASLPEPIIIFLRKILNKMLRNFLLSHFKKKAHVCEILAVHLFLKVILSVTKYQLRGSEVFLPHSLKISCPSGLSLRTDWQLISPLNITLESTTKAMRI